MIKLRASPFIHSFLLPLAVLVWAGLAACTSWNDVRQPVEHSLEQDRPDRIRVSLAAGDQIVLTSPRVRSDSLVGIHESGSASGGPTSVSIPLTDVRGVEVNKTDALKTTALAVGVGALIVAGIAIASSGDSGGNEGYSEETSNFSCPLVYSWDGSGWRLDSGTFGGAIFEPLSRTDVDGLEHARAEDGIVKLRLANELAETDHVDALSLLVVDHASGAEVIPDGSGSLHIVNPLAAPLAARDDHGRDVLAALTSQDGWGWESSPTGRDTSVTADVRSALELEFRRPSGAATATLVVHGNNTPWASWLIQDLFVAHGSEMDAWYAAMSTDPAASRALGEVLASEAFLSVSVRTANTWQPQGLVWEAGPEIAKRQAVRLDLAGVEGDVIRVRLESVPLFWHLDQVGIDFTGEPGPEAVVIWPGSALMESDGRDVRNTLARVDGDELVLETGDAAELTFEVPPVAEDHTRSYLIATTGWYRIHVSASDAPPRPELARIGTEPLAVSRLSVARLNEALAGLETHRGEDGR